MELLVGDIAKKAGVNMQTVKYYERRGLLLPVHRKDSGYRVYDEESIRRLKFIKQAQELGFSLKEIEELLKLRSSSSANKCAKVLGKAEAKLREVEEKATRLSKMGKVLQKLITDCRQRKTSDSCPILECCEAEC